MWFLIRVCVCCYRKELEVATRRITFSPFLEKAITTLKLTIWLWMKLIKSKHNGTRKEVLELKQQSLFNRTPLHNSVAELVRLIDIQNPSIFRILQNSKLRAFVSQVLLSSCKKCVDLFFCISIFFKPMRQNFFPQVFIWFSCGFVS